MKERPRALEKIHARVCQWLAVVTFGLGQLGQLTARTAMAETKAWARSFVTAVEAGDAGKAMQIVVALTVRSVDEDDVPFDIAEAVFLDRFLGQLAAESSPVRRNQAVRDWLAVHRAIVIQHWAAFGLPMPPRGPEHVATPLPLSEPEPAAVQACIASSGSFVAGGAVHSRGLVVFDFDLTLATKNVGIFDLEDCVNRCFGGAKRVAMLHAMLQDLSDSGIQMVVLTFNSSHTVRKALGPRPGCGLLPLLRGTKTNTETIIGCEDYTHEERSKTKGRGEVFVKSAAINARWVVPGRFQADQILFVVSKNH